MVLQPMNFDASRKFINPSVVVAISLPHAAFDGQSPQSLIAVPRLIHWARPAKTSALAPLSATLQGTAPCNRTRFSST
jgi:hypothetical protein